MIRGASGQNSAQVDLELSVHCCKLVCQRHHHSLLREKATHHSDLMESSGESTADPFIARKSQELAELQSELSTLQTSFQSLRTQHRPSSARRAKAEDPTHRFTRPSSALSKSLLSRALKVEQHLGPEIWKDLKFVFVKYASLQNCLKPDSLELSMFFRLLEDCQMLNGSMTRARAQLLFCQNNKARSIDLWRFLEVVAEFAKAKYQRENRLDAIRQYTQEVIVPNSRIEAEQEQLRMWKQEANELHIRELHYAKRSELLPLFNQYRTLEREYADRLLLPAFLNFCSDFKFIPDLTTKPEAARLFRAAGNSQLFVDSLTFVEFQGLCGLQAISIFSRAEFAEKCPGPMECVETWYFWLEVNAGLLAASEAPVKERGLVVDPSGLALRI